MLRLIIFIHIYLDLFFFCYRSDLCDYSNPRNQEPWFCIKPRSKTCTKITNLQHVGGIKFNSSFDFDKLCEKHACRKAKSEFIKVKENRTYPIVKANFDGCLEKTFFNSLVSDETSGYYVDDEWQSLKCGSSFVSLHYLENCLDNKVIYFLGDSTVRQYFSVISTMLNLKVEGPDTTYIWQQPTYAHSTWRHNFKLHMFYRAHGPPLINPGPPYTRPYITDSIINIPDGGKDTFVIICIGIHLYFHHPSYFIHRLKGIKRAINIHLNKFPQTNFVIKGLNVAELKKPIEWNIYRLEMILRQIFSQTKRVAFFNCWDITTVRPLVNNFHPTTNGLNQQVGQMMRYICRKTI